MKLKSALFGSTMILGLFVLAPRSHGDTISSLIQYDVGGAVGGAITDTGNFNESKSIFSPEADPIFASVAHAVAAGGNNGEVNKGYADYASVNLDAHVEPGILGVNIAAQAMSTNSTAVPIRSNARVDGTVTAGWSDTATIETDLLPFGFPIRANGSLLLEGSVGATSFGELAANSHFTQGSIGVLLDSFGDVTVPQGKGASANDNIAHQFVSNQQPEGLIPVTIEAVNGGRTIIGARLTLTVHAEAETISLFPPVLGEVGTSVFGNLGSTVRWGGISSVIDLTTGQPIENWTITSASGLDYSKPAQESVPEPTALLLLSTGLLGLASWRRRFASDARSSLSIRCRPEWGRKHFRQP